MVRIGKYYVVVCVLFYTIGLCAQTGNRSADSIVLLQLHKEVSEHYFSKGTQAITKAERAILFAIALKDTAQLADLYKMYGVMKYFIGEHDKALQYYFKALHLYQQKGDLRGTASVYNEIGTLYKKNNRLNEAQEMFDNAYTIALNMRDTIAMATSLNNGGIVYEMRNDLNTAILQYNKALRLYVLKRDTIGQSYCFENIGGVYLMQKNYKDAEQYLVKSLNYRKLLKMDQPTAFSYYYLGDLYQQKGDYSKAIGMYENSLELATKLQYLDLIQKLYYALAETNKKMGQFEKAFAYFSRATVIKDSLFNVSRSEQLSEIQTKYEVENKAQENKLLKQRLELEAQKANNRNLILLVFVVSAILLVIGGVFFYRRRQADMLLQTQLKIHRAEQEQRLRISHDLHDHVGAQLSYVVSNLDIANAEFSRQQYDSKRLQSVTDMSKQAILTLRETVWALSNESISLEAFADKFKAYVKKMSEFSTDIKIEMMDRIEFNATLPPNTALHLFRICQEAFSNALKHAKSSKIYIEIVNDTHAFLEIKIGDNGIGFNIEEAINKGHYGLQNMQHRAAEIGALYQLNSQPNRGTEVCIIIKEKNTTYA